MEDDFKYRKIYAKYLIKLNKSNMILLLKRKVHCFQVQLNLLQREYCPLFWGEAVI